MVERQLRALLDGGRVKRMHVMDVLQSQTVAEHTFGVVCVLMLITPKEEGTLRLFTAAMVHDVSEREFGDVPGHAKREPDVRSAYERLEEKWARDIGFHYQLSLEQKTLLELADRLEFMAFCVRERQMGNTLVKVPYSRAFGWVDNILKHAPDIEKYGYNAVNVFNMIHSWWRATGEEN